MEPEDRNECPRCGGPLASDGVCADDECGADTEADEAQRGEPSERYTLNVIVKPTARERHGFVVIEDNQTGDNAATFDGPDALLNATAGLARLQASEEHVRTETCCVKSRPGNMPCGKAIEYLTSEQASERGVFAAGWRHVNIADATHPAVPKSWVS